jgi:transcriptional regulator with PAS, ATPase and Fis domain
VNHLIGRLNLKLGRRLRGIEPEALEALGRHDWRGNVRELEHVLERAMILGDGELVGLRHIVDDLRAVDLDAASTDLRGAVRRFTRRHIMDVLAQVQFDKRAAARRLGISLASLYRKLSVDSPGGQADEMDEEE